VANRNTARCRPKMRDRCDVTSPHLYIFLVKQAYPSTCVMARQQPSASVTPVRPELSGKDYRVPTGGCGALRASEDHLLELRLYAFGEDSLPVTASLEAASAPFGDLDPVSELAVTLQLLSSPILRYRRGIPSPHARDLRRSLKPHTYMTISRTAPAQQTTTG